MASSAYYFDYAAATPVDEQVLARMQPYWTELFFNPSSPYAPALDVRRDYNTAKQQIAHAIGAGGDELIMTAGATESINLAVAGFGGHKVTTTIEHASVRRAVMQSDHTIVPVDRYGRVTPAALRAAIRPDTQFVSVALANHEIGTLQPLRECAQIVRDVRAKRRAAGDTTPLVLHCDASQGFGLVDVHVGRMGVDLLTLSAAKLYGPKQVGLLWVRPGVVLKPIVVGGGQEAGLRSGTENVAGVIGFAEAVRQAVMTRHDEATRLRQLRDQLETSLTTRFPNAVLSGHPRHRLANFCHVSFPGIDAERLVFLLERESVYVATGSACAANSGTRSTVLTGIGLDAATADGSLRLTLGRSTTKQAVTEVAARIIAAVETEQQRIGAVQ